MFLGEKAGSEDNNLTDNLERTTRSNYVKVVSYQPVTSSQRTYRIPEVQATRVGLLRSSYTPYDEFTTRTVSSSDIEFINWQLTLVENPSMPFSRTPSEHLVLMVANWRGLVEYAQICCIN
ncbi:hypothetical protein TSMEX_009349 [Taenia solium]|eukprot:TsM_000273700 transcript=TsM_000273700 gene=TsM_000273700